MAILDKQNVQILIVEDEAIIVEFIKEGLKELSQNFHVCKSLAKVKEIISNNDIDLAILDVTLSMTESGIAVGQYLRTHSKIPYIFLTGHSDPVMSNLIQQAKPFSYLIKPVNERKLFLDAQRALKEGRSQSSPDSNVVDKPLTLKINGKRTVIRQPDVIYLESEGNYTKLISADKKYLAAQSLKSVAVLLNTDIFVRVHRAYMVNLKFVTGYSNEKIDLANGHVVPLGRKYLNDFRDRFNAI